ncbi:MAG: c-type cytochrome [Mariprofundaceae bacterium]
MAGLPVKAFWFVALLLGLSACSDAAAPDTSTASAFDPAHQAVSEHSTSTLVFEPSELDMGTVKEGEKAVAHILIRNSGSKMENIVSMQTSCGCSVAEPEQRLLMPGAFTRATISIDTFAKQDEVKKWVELTDGQGRRSRAVLHLKVLPSPHMKADTRSIFDGKCATCHFDPAKGKESGPAIYQAVCSMCHGNNAAGAYAPSLHGHQDVTILGGLIAHGSGTRHMPGFALREGGPLDDKQIRALAEWLLTLDD